MTMRLAIGGFMHESHSFAPQPTTFPDFMQPGGFPRLQRGAGLIDAVRHTSVPIAGAIAAAETVGATLVPLCWCFANPAGPIADDAFERICAMLIDELAKALDAGNLDGVYLDLHGAAVAVSFPDAEGELLRRVRALIGDRPLTISLDPHANLTARMVALSDAVVPFRTYPHIDMKAAGAQAMRLLFERIARGRPWARAFRQLDFWLPLGSQCTMLQPMGGVMTARAELARHNSVAELAFCFGFPFADFPDCGAAIAAFADTQEAADATADAFAAHVAEQEADFVQDTLPAVEAVAAAKRIAAGARRPVVLADTQDNPGGGGHGDTTGLLAELVRQEAVGAVVCLINDAESAAACYRAGEGSEVSLSLGGKSNGLPLVCKAQVEKLTDGTFTFTGPMGKGNPADLGRCALVSVPPGIHVMIVSRKVQALDQAILRHVGVEPAQAPILALKSSVHFRADFAPIAERIIVAIAPGPVVADPATLPFKHVRPGVRMRPRARARG
jgi:microcystin degradation protein MlrC